MFFRRKKRKKTANVSALQVQHEVNGTRFSASLLYSEKLVRKIISHMERLLLFVRADLEAVKALLPEGEMSRRESAKLFDDNYHRILDLVRDGLYADSARVGRLQRKIEYFRKGREARRKLLNYCDKLFQEYHNLTAVMRSIILKLLQDVLEDLRAVSIEAWPKRITSYCEYIRFFKEDYCDVLNLIAATIDNVRTLGECIRIPGLEEQFNVIGVINSIIGEHSPHFQMLLEARARFESDIAEGLDTLEEAKAYYWIAFTLHPERSIAFLSDGYVRRESYKKLADIPLKLAVKKLRRHLRSNPQDVEALELLVSCFRILGRTDALYEAEMELKKVQAARTSFPGTRLSLAQKMAWLKKVQAARASFSVSPSIVKPDRSGISFELKCQNLLETMGFVAVTTSTTNDGGIDVVATRTDPILSGKYIVQCKDWQSSVGVKLVRE